MARLHYYVLHEGGGWKVRLEGRDYPCATQAAAIRAAIDAAHEAGRQGREAQVLVQGVDGAWRTEWTYGSDPYPPAG